MSTAAPAAPTEQAWVGVKVDSELKEQLGGLAHAHERTLSGEVRLALRRHVEREQGLTIREAAEAAAA